jgi:cathepsin B
MRRNSPTFLSKLWRALRISLGVTFGICAIYVCFPAIQDLLFRQVYGNEFDARAQWPNCSFPIYDQGPCGACWAMGLVGVMSDAACTQHGEDVQLAPQPILSCAQCGHGCRGGGGRHYNGRVVYDEFDDCFAWVKKIGLPEENQCPYKSAGCSSDEDADDGCVTCPTCEAKLWYFDQVRVGAGPAALIPGGRVGAMMRQIQQSGSVLSSFTVYHNFMYYFGGVYRSTDNTPIVGRHAIRIIGWGKDKTGQEYWIIANSWSRHWGEGGFFRFDKGQNLCMIECGDVFSAQATSRPAGRSEVAPDNEEFVSDLGTFPEERRTTWWEQDIGSDHWQRHIAEAGHLPQGNYTLVTLHTSVAAGLHLDMTVRGPSGIEQISIFEPLALASDGAEEAITV